MRIHGPNGFDRQGRSNTPCTFVLRSLVVLAGLLAVCSTAQAQMNSRPGAVVLVARISDQVGIQWGAQPVTAALRQLDILPSNSEKQAGYLFAFQNTVHVAMGSVVQGESSLDSPTGHSEMLAFDPNAPAASPVMSLLGAPQTNSGSWRNPDPRNGRQQVLHSCLVVTEDGDTPLLRIRLSAL